MIYKLRNNQVEIIVESLGAELKSFKILESEEEFMWDGNPEFWGRTSPVLFPIVGGLKDNSYTYNGKKYQMNQHGLARDCEFELVSQKDNKLLFLLNSSNQTLELYPFEFKFYIEYSIKGKELNIEYRVENQSTSEIYFSVGGHPAFSTPVNQGVSFEDYYLEFEKKETSSAFSLDGRYISREKTEFLNGENIISLKEDTFKNDAIIFKGLESKKVSLKCRKNKRIVTMDYSDFDYIAFWNKVGSTFVCLEPWNGIADFVDASGKLEEKDDIIKLEKNKTYSANLKIEIGN